MHAQRSRKALSVRSPVLLALPSLAALGLAACGGGDEPTLEEALRATSRREVYEPAAPAPPTAEELVRRGNVASVQGRMDEAVTAFREALALAPEDAQAHFALGTTLVPLSHTQVLGSATRDFAVLDEAIEHLAKAAALEPESAEFAYWHGRALDLRGHDAEAILELRRAIELDPGHGMAHKRLGLARLEGGDVAGARTAFEAALETLPEDPGVPFQLGNLWMEEDPARARDLYLRASEIDPTFPWAYHGLSQALAQLGDVEGAEAAREKLEVYKGYEQRLEALVARAGESPRDFQAQYDAGEMYRLLGQDEEALTMFRRALELDPGHAGTHYYCGLILSDLGELEAARDHFEEAWYLDPELLGARVEVARVAALLGDEARAAEVAEGLAEAVAERDAATRATVGEVLLATAHRDEGVALLRGVLEEEPGNEAARLLLEQAER